MDTHLQPFASITDLEEALSRPPALVLDAFASLPGDILILGAGGKLGPTLAMMLKRALPDRRVVAVSRFGTPGVVERLQERSVEILAGDLLDETFLESLPAFPNVYYLAGMKFGATGNEPLTWAMNAWLPAMVCRRFASSRLVILSTGNVYGLTQAPGKGAHEDDALHPIGEYANSCLARERLATHFSTTDGTPMSVIRLNYANEPRYGIVVDIARKILTDKPIDLSMGWVNLIWQGDANAAIAAAMARTTSPPDILNVAGSQPLQVRTIATTIGEWLQRAPQFEGEEATDALLSDAQRLYDWIPLTETPFEEWALPVVRWIADDHPTHGKPTHYGNRAGNF